MVWYVQSRYLNKIETSISLNPGVIQDKGIITSVCEIVYASAQKVSIRMNIICIHMQGSSVVIYILYLWS